jgi:hypothetical protein
MFFELSVNCATVEIASRIISTVICRTTSRPPSSLTIARGRRTAYRRTKVLTSRRMTQSDAWRMLQRRARDAGIPTAVGNHPFRTTGITAYLDNGGSLENAQAMAAQRVPAPPSSTTARTTRSRSTRLRRLEFRNLH